MFHYNKFASASPKNTRSTVSAAHYVAPVEPTLGYHVKNKVPVCARGSHLLTHLSTVDGTPVYECKKKETYRPHLDCEPDWTIVEDQCVKVETKDVLYKCPANWSRYGTNQCVSHIDCPIQTKCEQGVYDPHTQSCSLIMSSEAKATCPSDTVKIGLKCFAASIVDPRISCPVGFAAQGLDCVREIFEDPKLVCPDATTKKWENGVYFCEGKKFVDEEYNCPAPKKVKIVNGIRKCESQSSAAAPAMCPPGFTLLAALEAPNTTDLPVCHKPIFKKAEYSCDQSKQEKLQWNIQTRMYECVFTVIDETGSWDCPSNTTPEYGRCVYTEEFAEIELCKKSHQELRDGKCVETQYTDLHTDCENGQYDPVNEICYNSTSVPASFDCPVGCRNIDETSRCFCETKTEPLSYCEPGCSMVGGKCEKDNIVTAKAECPDGYGYAGRGHCEHKAVREPTQSCHNDDIIENGVCADIEVTEPSFVCPDTYVETKDGKCVLHTAAPNMII
jgi:hypothetical protein